MGALQRVKGWPPVAAALDVQRRVGELGGGFLASAVTLTLFLSLFPMLLVAVAVLGFLSAGDSTLAGDIVGELGLTGDTAEAVVDNLAAAEEGRAGTGVLGGLGLVWAAVGVVGAIEHVCDRTWQLPTRGLMGKLFAIGWMVGALVLLGASMVLTALLAVLPGWAAPLQLLGGVALLVAFFLFTFRFLTSRALPLSDHLPGALFAGVGFQLLRTVGAVVVARQTESSTGLYGSIGVVLALLAWLLLFGRLLVYAVVLNVVLHEHHHGTVRVEVEVPRLTAIGPANLPPHRAPIGRPGSRFGPPGSTVTPCCHDGAHVGGDHRPGRRGGGAAGRG